MHHQSSFLFGQLVTCNIEKIILYKFSFFSFPQKKKFQNIIFFLPTKYVDCSRVCVMTLKQCVSTFTKGNQSLTAYLHEIKAISNEHTIINSLLDNFDLIIHTLNRSNNDYKEITTELRNKETSIKFAELHENSQGP